MAVLVDAVNASAQHLEQLLVEIAKYGKASVRRAYGDWTSTRLTSWKAELRPTGEGKAPIAFVRHKYQPAHRGYPDDPQRWGQS